MRIRSRILFMFAVLALLSLMLVACERERPPVVTPGATTAPRGTVAPSPTPPVAATQVGLPGVTGTAGAQATPAGVVGATSTAPAPQPVVVGTPGATGAAEGAYLTYTVEAGDTLAAIAARYNVTQDAIVQLNGLSDPDALKIGQQLKIPSGPSEGASTTTTGGTSVYVVQSGDTLAAIARRFGTTVTRLVELNSLVNPDRIAVGQRLLVPATGGATAPATDTTGGQRRTHVVQTGDTLMSIAQRYGVTVKAIQDANNITDPDRIYPGQVLVIP